MPSFFLIPAVPVSPLHRGRDISNAGVPVSLLTVNQYNRMFASDLDWQAGSINMRKHSEQVKNLAAVVLAKLKVSDPNPKDESA